VAARASDVDDTNDAPEALSCSTAAGILGGRRHGVRHEHDAAGRGAEPLRGAVDGEPGGGEAERNRGQAGTASRLAVWGEVAGGCE
jgi:hypothetical protein